jgi:hypothetical protein
MGATPGGASAGHAKGGVCAGAPRPPHIFISYARSDGERVATQLRRRLSEEHGFSLWRDRADLEGGKDWWQQIVEALQHVEYLVLVLTPAALHSEMVRREWRLARQQGVCVIPVLATPDLDLSGFSIKFLNIFVVPVQLHARVGVRELPLHGRLVLLPLLRPRQHFAA